MCKVALLKIDDYINLDSKIEEIINLIDPDIIKKDAKVFIKLNCVGPFDKDLAITTHPSILESVIKLVLTKTQNIIVGDNPATKEIKSVMKKCGLLDVCNKYNVSIIDQSKITTITNPTCNIYKSFEVSTDMIENDLIINLPKLKTHGLTYMTGGVKNFFGLIYGLQKASWHSKASNPLVFGDALCDLYGALLNSYKGKILTICDGINALDGDGPSTGGIPTKANVLLCSLDAVALDYISAKVVGLDPKKHFVVNIASQRKYGDITNIELVGSPIEAFTTKFKGPSGALPSFGLKILRISWFRNLLLEHPVIIKDKCIKCGECIKICPEKTLKMKTYPTLKPSKCIRCFCCSEVCPVNAIKKSKKPLLAKIFFK